MTGFFDGLLAVLLVAFLNALILSRVRRSFDRAEGNFLARVYFWTLLVRMVGAVILNVQAGDSQFADTFWGDSGTYDAGGYVLAQGWTGDSYATPLSSGATSGYGFIYFVGVLYFFFGRNQLLVQLLNGTIGSLAVLVIYSVARQLFNPEAARWASLFMAFFPQMIFWSFAMYKDPSILLCIAVSMYAVLKLRVEFRLSWALLFVAACIALMTLRFYIFYMVSFATLGTFLFAQRRGLFGGLLAQVALICLFVAAVVFGVRSETLEQQTAFFDLERLQNARVGQAMLSQSAYGSEFNVSTPEGALAALPVGLAYLLFAPFPWAITGLRQQLTLPETLVWYSLMPSLLRGLVYTVRNRFREALPIIVFASVLTVAYAVFQSNVGTAYRQRTQISMFFFVFMGVGIEQRQRKRAQRQSHAGSLAVRPRPL